MTFMTYSKLHISVLIIFLFILSFSTVGQDLSGSNLKLPATTSTVGSIKIGSWNALNMYGIKNIYVGNSGNFNSPSSDSNAALGYGALRLINNASRNVAVGPYAGGRIVNADGNVWIGNEAGNDSTFKNIDNIGGIDNSDTICPLIFFDFENNQVRICGTLDVNNGITGIDSVLWYLNGDTIINKSRHLVTIDSGLFLPHPQSNTRLGYVLAWEHTNGRVFPVEISQLSDTITEVGVGYWTLDSLNGIIYLNDTNWYTRLMTLGVDEITSFTPDLETHYDINCDTVFVDTTQGFYEFNYSDQSVSITGNEFNYDIELGDRIFVYFHCVSSMPGCDTNFYLTPRVYFDVDSIDYNETFDSVTYIGDGMNYSPCQSDMCSYDQELYYKIGYIKCDDSVATTTYPVTINDNVIILGDTIKIPNLIEDTTNKIIYYNEANGGISYGEVSSDTSFWIRTEDTIYNKDSTFIKLNNYLLTDFITGSSEYYYYNTFLGYGSFEKDTSFIYGRQTDLIIASTGIGFFAGYNSDTVSGCNFLGNSSGNSSRNITSSSFVGINTGQLSSNIENCSFIGNGAGEEALNISFSDYIGNDAGMASTNSTNNIIIGSFAGYELDSCNNSIAFGVDAVKQANRITGSAFIGNYSGENSDIVENSTFIGPSSGRQSKNIYNSNFFGISTGSYSDSIIQSSMIGYFCGQSSKNIFESYFIGSSCGHHADNVNYSQFYGFRAGSLTKNISNSTYIGDYAGYGSRDIDSCIFIGNGAGGYTNNLNNKLYIENSNADSAGALIFGNFATDKLRINGTLEVETLPERSAPYLVGWDNTTKQLTAIDSTGVVFHSETGFYQEELSTTKTIFNLGFTITNNALVSLNGTIINPSQWTGIGTSTLILLLDTQQYDLFTIKQ